MTIFCLVLVAETIEMILHSYRALEPWLFLAFQIYKCASSSLFLGIEVYEYATKNQSSIYLWALIIVAAMV